MPRQQVANEVKTKWPEMDYNQDKIIKKLEQYLKFKRQHIKADKTLTKKHKQDALEYCQLPFNSTEGLCQGLVAYWLYFMHNCGDGKFLHQLQYLLHWSASKMSKTATEDKIIEEFLNAIAALQFDYLLRFAEISQQNKIDESFNAIGSGNSNVRNEYNLCFAFNQQTLAQFIDAAVKPGKMIYLNNIHHVVGLIYIGGVYYLYNPNSKKGALSFTDSKELAASILQEYKEFTTNKLLTMYISCLDSIDNPVPEYPGKPQYYQALMQDPKHLEDMLHEPELLYLIIKHGEVELLSLLLSAGMRLDTQPIANNSLVGIAIEANNFEILYLLLANGADMHAKHKFSSLWDTACINRNAQTLALLLAFGYTPPENFGLISAYFEDHQIIKIYNAALDLNTELLQVPSTINLDQTNDCEVLNFLKHAKLRIAISHNIDDLAIVCRGKIYTGANAVSKLASIYKQKPAQDLFGCTYKTEIFCILQELDHKSHRFEYKDLILLLDQIKQLVSNQKSTPRKEDLIEISIILKHIDEIVAHPANFATSTFYLRRNATAVKTAISKYLKKYGITSLEDHLAKLDKKSTHRNYMFFTPDKDQITPEFELESVKSYLNQRLD